MAFIVEHDNYLFYHTYLKYNNPYDRIGFEKYWFAQEMCHAYTEDEYTNFLRCYVGKRLFDKFIDDEGLMGDFEEFCNLHEYSEIERTRRLCGCNGLMSLNEDYTTIFNYWLKDYILYWKKHLNAIHVSMRKSAIIQMAIRQYEMDTPCLHNRTVQQLEKSIKSILEKEPQEEGMKWRLLCSMEDYDIFFESLRKKCSCTLCKSCILCK